MKFIVKKLALKFKNKYFTENIMNEFFFSAIFSVFAMIGVLIAMAIYTLVIFAIGLVFSKKKEKNRDTVIKQTDAKESKNNIEQDEICAAISAICWYLGETKKVKSQSIQLFKEPEDDRWKWNIRL